MGIQNSDMAEIKKISIYTRGAGANPSLPRVLLGPGRSQAVKYLEGGQIGEKSF